MVSIPEFETAPTTTSDAPSTGHLTAGAQESTYVGDSHWTSILGSISDLRRDLEDNETREDTDPNGWQIEHDEVLEDDPSQSSNLLKAPKRRTKKELIALLPARQEVDRLVSQWFNSSDPFKPMLHPPTFQAEYKRFWQNPDNAPTMWIGLLYSILSLAAAFDLRKSPDVSSPKARLAFATATEYHDMAASAAVLADYTTPKAYTIECLLLYTSGLRSKNAFVDVWILLGVIVRLAMRMGYHRDARHYSQLTPFQGEMRRRMWHALVMIEVLISFQIGLPSIVRTLQSDCQPPRNLLDSDLNVTMKELPPNRPFEELTPVSYSIAKVRITNVFAAAAELSHRTIPPAYTQMMELDQQIEVARSLVPTRLLGRPLDQCITDPPELIMASLNLDRLYLKTKVVLHRRFMRSTTATELGTPESRKICIDCSMRMLTQHHEVHEASQPGGQMEMVSWYMGTISTYDFLLAAAILCMELSQQGGDQTSSFQLEACDQTEMVKKLERSKAIWDETNRLRGSEDQPAVLHSAYQESIFVHDTEKAAKALGVMLAKINARYKATAVDSTVHAQAMRASSAGERANVEFGITGWTQDQSADLAALGDLFAIPEDIDWVRVLGRCSVYIVADADSL